jgi:hypothetical protein
MPFGWQRATIAALAFGAGLAAKRFDRQAKLEIIKIILCQQS